MADVREIRVLAAERDRLIVERENMRHNLVAAQAEAKTLRGLRPEVDRLRQALERERERFGRVGVSSTRRSSSVVRPRCA
jgi:hypothetical protein